MIVDKKIMELIDSVVENKISPIEKALLATEIQLHTNKVVEEKKQALPCYSCQGGGCPVCCGYGFIPQD